MQLNEARTLLPTYRRGILENGEEIAPDVYVDQIPRKGEIHHIADNIYLSGNELDNLETINTDNAYFKHMYVKKGSCQIKIGTETVNLVTGSILHLGRRVQFQVIHDDDNPAEFLTILHNPQDVDEKIKHEWDNKWHLRKPDKTTSGYWIGGFVDNTFPPAQSSELAVGIKTLLGNITEAQPHSHLHQLEINAVIRGGYEVEISSPYSNYPSMVDVRQEEMLIVGDGLFSGTRNNRLLSESCDVFIIQTPNLQPSEKDKTITEEGLPIKSETWTASSLIRRKNQ